MSRLEEIKKATGIECANCSTCRHKGTDGDGYEYNGEWDICEHPDKRIQQYSNLKTFPFKKDMKCWEPNFWHSKFADRIKEELDIQEFCDDFHHTVNAIEAKYTDEKEEA